ncbi:MAG: histidine phosphatase family protein [Anaerolineales bacterium]|nr:histidine phosphatase family protein [Anaerolineales bacterium]
MSGIIYLARHGETIWNAERRIQGRQDVWLNERGFQQRKDLFGFLKNEPLSRIYTSALRRTIHTGEPLSDELGCPLIPMADLNELGFGVMEGVYLDSFSEEDQALWDWWQQDLVHRRLPGGGESREQLRDRVDGFLDAYRPPADQKAILIVGHMGTNQMLLHRLLGLELQEALLIFQPNNCIYRLHIDGDPRVEHILIPAQNDPPVWMQGLNSDGPP